MLVDGRALEHEGIQILHYRQLGSCHAIADRGGVAVSSFRAQQVSEDFMGSPLALKACGHSFVERACHAFKTQLAHGLDHLMPLH